MTVAVATGMEGFRTLGGLVGAVAFHAVVSAVGMQMLVAAAKRKEADSPAQVSTAAEGSATAGT